MVDEAPALIRGGEAREFSGAVLVNATREIVRHATDVQILRDRLAQVRGKWLVTLNDTPAIRTIFAGCELRPIERRRGIDNKAGRAPIYRELIITA